MKTAKKLFSIFTIIMCLALVFTACTPIPSGGGGSSSTPTSSGGTGGSGGSGGGGSSSGGSSKTVTLTLNLDGGKIDGKTTYSLNGNVGSAVTRPANPVKDGFAFSKWNPNLPAKYPASNATYKAEYIEIEDHHVVLNLDAHGGELPDGNTLVGEENDGVTAPRSPTRHGYDFASWNPPLPATFSKADDGKNFVAEWEAKEVTLVLRLDGGNIDGRTGEYKIIGRYDEARTEDPHPEKQHYKFANWSSELPLKFSIDDNNKIFTAKWEYVPADHIVLRLDTDGGNMSGARELDGKEGTPVPSVATPEKHGYNFAGWTPTIPTNFPSADATYKATWTAKNVRLVFKTDSAAVHDTLNGKQDETVTAPSSPSKKGYTFDGWSPSVPEKFDIDDNGKEYTARWVAKNVNLKLSLNGGNIGGSTADYTLTGKHDASVTVPAALAKKGYDLSGWSPALPQKFSVDDEGRSYTAQWQPKEVRLVLNLDGGKIGGSTEKTLTGKHGETVTGADGAARNGYDFAGWYPALPAKFDIDDYGKTYTAQWNAKDVTLVLYRENGVEYTRLNGKHDGAVTAPAAPTKADYAFVKWNPPLPEKFSVDDTNTYIAEWRYLENDHVVLEFDANGGHLENHTLVGKEGDSVPKGDIGTPDKFGYDFTGWNTAIPDKFPHTNMTFTAGWRAKDVRIVFMLDGGTVYRTLDGKHGGTLTKPADPTKTGYNFTGWDAAVPGTYSIDDNNKVLTATWEAKDITATFSLNGGNINGSTANRPLTGKYGSTLTAPSSIVKNGYTLTGWNPPLPATYTENATYTAQWEAKDVTIVFKTYGGTVYKTLTGKHGTALTKPADPTRTGYDFKGWDAAVPITYSIDDNNKVFTATWEAKDVIVTLALNGGNIGGNTANKPLTGKYGTAITVPQDLARNGYNLTGWSPALPQTFDVADSGKTYTAQWTAISYSITYNLNGGTNSTGAKTAYTIADATFTLPHPTKAYYTFKGWYEKKNFTGNVITQIEQGSTGAKTFWAKWEARPMSLSSAIEAIKALGTGETLDVVLDSNTTQEVFDYYIESWDKNLGYILRYCKGKVNLDMSMSSITSIRFQSFYGSSSHLISVKLPDSVTSIEGNAFSDCSSLTSVNIPNGVTSIEGNAFFGCSSLTSVNIPGSVTSIGTRAFTSCSKLKINVDEGNQTYSSLNGALYNKEKSVLISWPSASRDISIPNGVTSIEGNAFSGCSSLTSVNIPDSVTSIGSSAFLKTGLTSVTISDNVTNIGSSAFSSCTWLTNVTIPGSVTNIGSSAFYGCTGLKNVVIENGVESIGASAFEDCTNLTSVKIPVSIKSIGNYAFRGCTFSTNTMNFSYDGSTYGWNNISFGSYWKEGVRTTGVWCSYDGKFHKFINGDNKLE